MKVRREELAWAVALAVAWVGFGVPEHVTGAPRLYVPSLELFLVGALALVAPRSRALWAVVAVAAGAWVVWITSHRVIERVYARAPAVVEDWRMALNLLHYVESATSVTVWGPAVGGLVALAGFGWAVFTLQQGLARERSPRVVALWLLALAVAGNVEVAGRPNVAWLEPKTPAVYFGLHAAEANVGQSRRYLAEFEEAGSAPVDRRYEALLQRRLSRKPNVSLLMIEAYGEVLFAPPFEDFTRTLTARVEAQLAAQGYGARTAFSEAPVYGGGSWLSMASMQVGIRIARPSQYALLERVGTRVPGFTRFFEAQGYRTYGLFPGNTLRKGLAEFDLYGRQVVLEGHQLDFHGHVQPWGAAPDQYAWGVFLERHLRDAPSPRFVTFMSVSTHWDWWYQAPYVEDWRTLGDADEANDVPAGGWEPIPRPVGPDVYEARYAGAVEYEWRVLLDVIAAEPDEEAVFVIIGDHQPYLGEKGTRGSHRTPVHVISRHQPTLEAFESAGFTPGLFAAPPATTTLWHEGLFSLVVTRLLMADGQADAAAAFTPKGLPLTGLRAVAP
jgi:hypothetical protein